MLFKYLPFFFCFSALFGEDPWGKDADLRYQECEPTVCVSSPSLSPFGQITEIGIRFHQEVISPCDGPRSHFRPSSSQYMRDAIHKYGFFVGVPMGCDRLMRENNDPWIYKNTVDEQGNPIKWDPVK